MAERCFKNTKPHLGVLRLWKSGLWGGIIGAVIAFFAWRMESTSPTLAGIAGVICLLGAFACNMIYWSKDRNPTSYSAFEFYYRRNLTCAPLLTALFPTGISLFLGVHLLRLAHPNTSSRKHQLMLLKYR